MNGKVKKKGLLPVICHCLLFGQSKKNVFEDVDPKFA